jgi:hypothetical protein
MKSTAAKIAFLGDLGDPWVAAIAGAFPPTLAVESRNCPAELSPDAVAPADEPLLVVVHRQYWSSSDDRLFQGWPRRRDKPARPVRVFCFGPFFRHEELERLRPMFDQMIPEATAAEILPGRALELLEGVSRPFAGIPVASFRVEVACGTCGLAQVLVQRINDGGYRAILVDESEIGGLAPIASAERALTIWEAPILEPDWPERLRACADASGPVIVLAGFADRAIVSISRAHGAVACLDLPVDGDDLLNVVDRIATGFSLDRWPIPMRMDSAHSVPPPRKRDLTPLRWPDPTRSV